MTTMTEEHPGIITLHGNPLTLLGPKLKKGDIAPDATLLDQELNEVNLSNFKGSKVIISSVPSLDTPVCDQQTRRFNKEADKLSNTKILTVSVDLPFAQARWCGAAGVQNLTTLSDHRDTSFGNNFGLLIKELRLLARAVIVVSSTGTIEYIELVPEVSDHPDYDAALQAARDSE